jgi:hypothetical protein
MHARRLVSVAIIASVALLGCSSDEATPEAMNDAVVAAASAVLQGPFQLIATEYTEDGDVLRSEWLDFRSNDEFRQVFGSEIEGRSSALGWIVVDGERFCATSGVGDACAFDVAVDQAAWTRYGPVGGPAGNTKPILDVLAADFVQMRLSPTVVERSTLGRSENADGSVSWTLSVPLANGLEHWSWTVDSDGVLTELTIRGEGVLALDRFERMKATFTRLDSPEPISPPEPGSAFDIDMLSVPDGVPLLTD